MPEAVRVAGPRGIGCCLEQARCSEQTSAVRLTMPLIAPLYNSLTTMRPIFITIFTTTPLSLSFRPNRSRERYRLPTSAANKSTRSHDRYLRSRLQTRINRPDQCLLLIEPKRFAAAFLTRTVAGLSETGCAALTSRIKGLLAMKRLLPLTSVTTISVAFAARARAPNSADGFS